MKKIALLLLWTLILLTSCAKTGKNELSLQLSQPDQELSQKDSEAYELLKNKCYICHHPNAASHDEIIAPPMAAVKMRYSMSYPSESEFTAAIVSWAMDPKRENALMKGAVNRFNVMPKQEFNHEELEKIALYIYNSELEEPEWFAAHQKSMQARGGGMGRGMHD